MRGHFGKIVGASSALLLLAATPALASVSTHGATRAGVVSSHPRLKSHDEPAPVGALGTATYNGTVINLAKSWDGAKACAVFDDGAAECFSSSAAMNAAIGTSSTVYPEAGTPTAQVRREEALVKRAALRAPKFKVRSERLAPRTDACEGNSYEWFYMFSQQSFGGQELAVQGVNYWYYLPDFGFGNKLASYINSTNCYVYMYQYAGGGGTGLEAPPYTSSPYLGADQDILNNVYIAD